MNRTKLIACLLALLMLVSFVACAKPSEEQGETPEVTTAAPSADTTAPESSSPVETTDPRYVSDLSSDTRFDGKTINLLVTAQSYAVDEFLAERINGETVNDAVYARNLAVEDRLGVKLNVRMVDSTDVYAVGDAVRNSVASGDRSYDIVTMPGYTTTSYVVEGDFYNLLEIENLDLEKSYWTQGFNSIISNGEKQYIASGAYSISMYRNMYITLYNKEILTAHGVEDLYNIVKRDEWTIDRQIELAKNIYIDNNGNNKKDGEDLFGFVTGEYTSTDPYWVSCNIPFLRLNDGVYSIEFDTEKLTSMVSKIQANVSDYEGVYSVGKDKTTDGSYITNIIDQFSRECAAMCTTMIFQIESYLTPSSFSQDYGIVPMPKYDDAQESYYTHVQDQLSVIAVVSSVPEEDLPMMGAVLESIAEESYKTIYPAYYENALSYKYLQNEQSVEMLDLIYNSIRIEGAFIYSSKFGILGKLRSLIGTGTNRVASTMKGYQKSWSIGADKLNSELENLKH